MMVTLWSGSVCSEQFEQQCVTRFVISGVGLFLLAQGQAAAFLAPAHFVARFFELRQSDAFQIRGAPPAAQLH